MSKEKGKKRINLDQEQEEIILEALTSPEKTTAGAPELIKKTQAFFFNKAAWAEAEEERKRVKYDKPLVQNPNAPQTQTNFFSDPQETGRVMTAGVEQPAVAEFRQFPSPYFPSYAAASVPQMQLPIFTQSIVTPWPPQLPQAAAQNAQYDFSYGLAEPAAAGSSYTTSSANASLVADSAPFKDFDDLSHFLRSVEEENMRDIASQASRNPLPQETRSAVASLPRPKAAAAAVSFNTPPRTKTKFSLPPIASAALPPIAFSEEEEKNFRNFAERFPSPPFQLTAQLINHHRAQFIKIAGFFGNDYDKIAGMLDLRDDFVAASSVMSLCKKINLLQDLTGNGLSDEVFPHQFSAGNLATILQGAGVNIGNILNQFFDPANRALILTNIAQISAEGVRRTLSDRPYFGHNLIKALKEPTAILRRDALLKLRFQEFRVGNLASKIASYTNLSVDTCNFLYSLLTEYDAEVVTIAAIANPTSGDFNNAITDLYHQTVAQAVTIDLAIEPTVDFSEANYKKSKEYLNEIVEERRFKTVQEKTVNSFEELYEKYAEFELASRILSIEQASIARLAELLDGYDKIDAIIFQQEDTAVTASLFSLIHSEFDIIGILAEQDCRLDKEELSKILAGTNQDVKFLINTIKHNQRQIRITISGRGLETTRDELLRDNETKFFFYPREPYPKVQLKNCSKDQAKFLLENVDNKTRKMIRSLVQDYIFNYNIILDNYEKQDEREKKDFPTFVKEIYQKQIVNMVKNTVLRPRMSVQSSSGAAAAALAPIPKPGLQKI